jgi:hypothetical protein
MELNLMTVFSGKGMFAGSGEDRWDDVKNHPNWF